jgi:hypothetical protein
MSENNTILIIFNYNNKTLSKFLNIYIFIILKT